MKKCLFALCLVLAFAAGSGWAHERGHRPRVGIQIGVPYGHYWWYGPPPYYYFPPPVILRPEPQVYIERSAPQPQAEVYWYYCSSPQGYHPYVKDCPGGWQRVVPTPPSN